MGTDAPDWERVVTTISGGSVSDAPDWQRTVTGPGAAPITTPFTSYLGWGQPSGQVASSYPFVLINSVFNLNPGAMYLSLVIASGAATVTKAWYYLQQNATSDLTPANNNIGLYDASTWSTGTLALIASGNMGSLLSTGVSLGYNPVAFSASADMTAGDPYYVGIYLDSASGAQTARIGYPNVGSQGYAYGSETIPWGGDYSPSGSSPPSSLSTADITSQFSGQVFPVGVS